MNEAFSLESAFIGGVFISGFVGWLVTDLFFRFVSRVWKIPHVPTDGLQRLPGWLTGVTERTFFFTLVGFGVSGTAPAMIAWIGIKMAANWNLYLDDRRRLAYRFRALLCGLVSLLFAVIGGLYYINVTSISLH